MRSLVGIALVGFACGVAWLQASAALPSHPVWIAALAACGSILVFTACARMRRSLAMVIALCAAATAGFGYAAWRAEARLAEALPQAWEGEDIEIVGVVDDLPSVSVQGTRFAFSVERVRTPRAIVPSRLSLAWFAPARPALAPRRFRHL